MNFSNNLPSTIRKAIVLATLLFWAFILSEGFAGQVSIFSILSIIPISIVCSLAILMTIVPFFLLAKENVSDDEIFKKYFPYYAITIFCFSSYAIISTDFESFICAFFITAFFTLMQSWIWISKTPITEKEKL